MDSAFSSVTALANSPDSTIFGGMHRWCMSTKIPSQILWLRLVDVFRDKSAWTGSGHPEASRQPQLSMVLKQFHSTPQQVQNQVSSTNFEVKSGPLRADIPQKLLQTSHRVMPPVGTLQTTSTKPGALALGRLLVDRAL